MKFTHLVSDVATRNPDPKRLLLDICRSLGSYSDACRFIVLKDMDFFVEHAKKFGDLKLCQIMSSCSDENSHKFENFIKTSMPSKWTDSKNQMCKLCPKFIESLQKTYQITGRNICKMLSVPDVTCRAHAMEFGVLSTILSLSHTKDICNIEICQESSTEAVEKSAKVIIASDSSSVKTFENKQKPERVKISFGDPLPNGYKSLPLPLVVVSDKNYCETCNQLFSSFSRYILLKGEITETNKKDICRGNETCKSFLDNFSHELDNPLKYYPRQVNSSCLVFFL